MGKYSAQEWQYWPDRRGGTIQNQWADNIARPKECNIYMTLARRQEIRSLQTTSCVSCYCCMLEYAVYK